MTIPVADADLFSDAHIASPWEDYRRLRDLGPVVRLAPSGHYAVPRYAELRAVLADHDSFVSGHGVASSDRINAVSAGNLLASDPPEHTLLREIVGAPLHPRALAGIRPRIEAEAEALIDRLVAMGEFDAVTDLAQHLPLAIVSHLVGLPEAGRREMLDYAAATFDMLGGDNARAEAALPKVMAMRAFVDDPATQAALTPGGWAARLWDAARAGRIPQAKCPVLMRDYLGPSLDTTIFATGHLVRRLAETPGAWDRLRETPSLAGNAINEAIRLDSPLRVFTRLAARPARIGGVAVPEGARVSLLYASANRDERFWDDPEAFDLSRPASAHLGFGHGIHACAGMQLARLEMRALLDAMIPRVARIETGAPVQHMNNTLYGFAELPARFVPA